MLTVLEIIKRTTDFFAGKGIGSPRLNAELLIGHALHRNRMQLYLEFERPLTEAELEIIRPLVRRRAQHEPVQYIIGETAFCGLTLKVDRRALIPRPETEQLIEQVRLLEADRPPTSILDLGTGSGAIALALAEAFPSARVTATDASPAALALARENAEATGLAARVTCLQSDWFAGLGSARFDLIVSNPPYLSPEETAQTPVEVHAFEPATALTAADGGLTDLMRIIADAPRFLTAGGLLALETGSGHHAELLPRLRAAGFGRVESKPDLTARDRFVFGFL